MIVVKFLRTLIVLLPLTVSEAEFNYDNPLEWLLTYPTCVGNKQSPIALVADYSTAYQLNPLVLVNYNTLLAHPVTATNNGHTVSIPIKKTIDGVVPSISGGGLASTYEIQDVRFHWGAPTVKPGSEHSINGKRYNMEIQLVHKNTNYATLEEASSHPDGIVILAVLCYEIESKYSNNTSLNSIYAVLPSLIAAGSTKVLTGSVIMRYFLNDVTLRRYFKYQGSLTTPPCSEAVTWFVFADPVPIAIENLKLFWALLDNRGQPLLKNFRSIQPSENREVLYHQP